MPHPFHAAEERRRAGRGDDWQRTVRDPPGDMAEPPESLRGRVLTAEQEFVLSQFRPYRPGSPGDVALSEGEPANDSLAQATSISHAQAMDIPLSLLARPGFPLSYFAGRGEAAVRRNMTQLSAKMRLINDSVRGLLADARSHAATMSRADYAAVDAISAILDRTQGVFPRPKELREGSEAPPAQEPYFEFQATVPADPREAAVDVELGAGHGGPAEGYDDLRRSLHRGLRAALQPPSAHAPPAFPAALRAADEAGPGPASTHAPPGRPRRLEPLPGAPGRGGGRRRPRSAPRGGPELSHVDDLYWVKRLVSVADGSSSLTVPALAPGMGTKGPAPAGTLAAHEGVVGLDGERATVGLTGTRVARREDVESLQGWLYSMVDKMAVHVRRRVLGEGAAGAAGPERAHVVEGGKGSPAPQDPGSAEGAAAPADKAAAAEDVADSILFVYSVAAEELQRQVGTECRERGDLLGVLWGQFFSLVELRSALKHRRDIAAAHRELQEERARRVEAEEAIK